MATQRHPIPLTYRILLVMLEPIMALNGSALVFFATPRYLAVMSPHLPPPHTPASAALAAVLASDVRILADQLAAMQLVFAFTLAIVLGRSRDVHTWRMLCAALLLSDLLHIAASAREMGRGGGSVGLGSWRKEDWVNFVSLGVMALARLGVILGIGVGEGTEEREGAGEREVEVRVKRKTG